MGFKKFVSKKDDKIVENAEIAINEDFSEANLVKVGTLISKLATKRLNTGKFSYLQSEKFKKSNGRSGVGVLFISTGGIIMRYNYLSNTKKGYSVNSIDYWAKGSKLGSTPSKSIEFSGENIVQLQDKLFDYLSTGKLDESYDGMYESFEELLEAKLSSREREEIRITWANKNGIKASYARSYTILERKAKEAGLLDDFYENFGGNISVQSNVEEVTDTQKVWAADEKKLGPSGIFADPNFVFDDMEEAAKVVAKGKWRSLIIAGMGGIGKTYGVKQVLTQELGPYGEGPDGKWSFYEGLSTSGFGLFKILLLNSKKLIVFDDSDAIWKDKDMINMMKIVTSDSGDRTITWASNSTANVALMGKAERDQYLKEYLEAVIEDPNTKMKPPSTFNFEGQMINISNMAANKFDDAIKSRAIFINVFLAQRDVIRRMYSIKKLQGLEDSKIKYLLNLIDPNSGDALEGIGAYGGEVDYVTAEDARKNKTMNMRTLDIAEAMFDAGVKNIEHMVSMYAWCILTIIKKKN